MRRLIYILAVLLLFVSCAHKELCYTHPHTYVVDVVFDWTNAPDASPKSMSLYLFSEDGTNPQRYELSGCNGGKIKVAPGTYRAICLNSDTRNIDCRNKEHISSFLITTKDEDVSTVTTSLGVSSSYFPRGEASEERLAREPEMLWYANLPEFCIEESDSNTITLSPSQVVEPISITIYNVQNLRHVYGLSGSITTLSEGILAGSGEHNGVGVTIPFLFTKEADNTTLQAQLLSFGDCASGKETHYINIYIVLTDGSKWHYTHDITAQMHSDNQDGHIHIILDDIAIPEPENPGGGGGGGFIPSVDGWNSVEIGIPM